MSAGSERPSTRPRVVAIAAIGAIACALAATGAFAAASPTVVFRDPIDHVDGPLDLKRVSLRRAADGRVRAALTFVGTVTAKTLLATSGPPGSVCLRIWTDADIDPRTMRPDRLVCATARSEDELRGGVYENTGATLPERLGDASVNRSSNGRSIVLRFTQSSLGRPKRIRFAVESTRPGCERPSCIDSAPDKDNVRAFRLR